MLEVDISNSREYLNRLIAASGIKVGTAKAVAVAAIIELLDENSLDGLLKSIQRDYVDARALCGKVAELESECNYQMREYDRLSASTKMVADQLRKLEAERNTLREEVQALQEELERLKGGKALIEMLPAERSRVLAYEKALEIGMKQLGNKYTDAERTQVIRSASNVAGGFMAKEESKV